MDGSRPIDAGVHVALLSIFGVVLGIGIGICIKPCVDRHNNKLKNQSQASTISGDRGLEAWSSAANRWEGCPLVCRC